jgi:hypothetical protein
VLHGGIPRALLVKTLLFTQKVILKKEIIVDLHEGIPRGLLVIPRPGLTPRLLRLLQDNLSVFKFARLRQELGNDNCRRIA